MFRTETKSRSIEIFILTIATAIFIFLSLYFIGATFLQSNPSYAATTALNIGIEESTTLTTSQECAIQDLSPTSPFSYCTITASVSSNNPLGYSLYLSTPEELYTTNDNTCLRHDSTIPPALATPTACSSVPASHKFSGITSPTTEDGIFITLPADYATDPTPNNLMNFTKGTWGVSYDSATSFAKFTGVPSYSGTPLLIKTTSTPTGLNDNTNIRVAAHYNLTSESSTNQMVGGYDGTIFITAIGAPEPPKTTWGNIQDFSSTQCDQMVNYNTSTGEIMYDGVAGGDLSGMNTVYTTDFRNGQDYRVRKMQDGKCWMIDNLKLYNYALTTADSDIASGSFALPSILDDESEPEDTPRIDNPAGPLSEDGGEYCSTTVFADNPDTTTGCGYLYTWYVATAGTGTAAVGSATVTDSICPKNWSLPVGGASGHFTALDNAISLLEGGGESWQGVYAGLSAFSGYGSMFQGSNGSYWTATYTFGQGPSILGFDDTPSVYVDIVTDEYYGSSVRCVL